MQSARLTETLAQTDLRVGWNSSDFGSVEVRAHISQNQVAATIAASHEGLRAAMAAEAPSLERSMAQQHLQLEQLRFDTRGGNADHSPEQQQHAPATPPTQLYVATAAGGQDSHGSEIVPALTGLGLSASRLNVCA